MAYYNWQAPEAPWSSLRLDEDLLGLDAVLFMAEDGPSTALRQSAIEEFYNIAMRQYWLRAA